MVLRASLIFISITAIVSCSPPEPPSSRSPASLGINPDKYINMLPTEKLRAAAREYTVMIGLKEYKSQYIGMGNDGIRAFNWDLIEKNKCFKNLTSKFYGQIAKHENFYTKKRAVKDNYSYNNLSETTSNEGIKSNWAWQLALNTSGGDSNLAMSLIGICGHDNLFQLPKASEVCKDTVINNIQSKSCNITLHSFPFTSSLQKKEHMKYRPNEEDGIACPSMGSPFFTQGSLGKETIIDANLRKQIAKIQAPTKGIGILPAKYYHTIGAAYATCSLVRGGMPGFMVKQVQSIGINTYRMFRLCEKGSSSYSDVSTQEVLDIIQSAATNPEICYIDQDPKNSWNYSKPGCLTYSGLQRVLKDPDITKEIIKRKVQRIIAEQDAGKLFQSKVIAGKKCRSVQLTSSNVDKIKEVASKDNCAGISSERCEQAKNVLKTWWVDFKWSEAQHQKGADFAIKNCKREKDFLKSGLERKSCEALKARKTKVETQENGSDQ